MPNSTDTIAPATKGLELTNELLIDVINSTSVGIAIMDLDRRFVFVNETAAALNGVPVDEHIGKTTREIIPEVHRMGLSQAAWNKLIETGEPVDLPPYECITRARPEPRMWSAKYRPMFVDGQIAGVKVTFQDVTEKHLAEDQLKHTLHQLEKILDVVPVGLVIAHDAECSRVTFNDAYKKMLGLSADADAAEWIATFKRDTKLVNGRTPSLNDMPLHRAAATGLAIDDARVDTFKPDGRHVASLVRAEPLKTNGVVTGAVAAYVDVTELSDQEDQLRAANKVKDDFLAMVSHELRTPLTVILGDAQLLGRGREAFGEEDRDFLADETYREAVSLTRIVENLLLMTRIDRGEVLEVEPILLRHVCRQAIDERSSAEVLRCRLSVPEELCVALGNSTSVLQVLRNLMSNALKYCPPESFIDISIEDCGDRVACSVADRGPGIDATDLERIFLPFFRASTSAQRSGMGIGLSVCKRLVESMNGTIWAEAREGGGTSFRFVLPKVPEFAD